ncbi:MAG: hypothetical protein Q9162_007444 [Coniocarpon cinnabarinum]
MAGAEGLAYQHDGHQVPFVTQQPSWPSVTSFANQHHLPQTVAYGPHQATIQQQQQQQQQSHNDSARSSVSTVDYAWPSYRPSSQGQPFQVVHGHNPFCQQHGKPEGDVNMTGHAGGCPQHPGNVVGPHPPPTPSLSDDSPQSSWASVVSPTESEVHHVAKRMKYDWGFDSNAPVLRPDGVRKKNAKFEIPDERNLDTLDALIKHASTDNELKELKMQKRLLRNREAALHSRQKKKSHTEWLERERDALMTRLVSFQSELTAANIRVDDLERDKTNRQEQSSQFEQRIATLQREKAMMLEQHTRETQRLNSELDNMREQLAAQQTVSNGSDPNSTNAFSSDTSVGFGHDSNFDSSDWQSSYEFIDTSGPDILVH